jgi:Leu/Phe-tRNA-protein transferase
MQKIQLGIYPLTYSDLKDPLKLASIYANTQANYYWSEDYSPHYYIAQAKAGFIAVTDTYQNQELLLPEIQFAYALLDFKDLHISKKVSKLIKSKKLQITIDKNIEEIQEYIEKYHKNNWLSKRYANVLTQCNNIEDNFEVITAYIEYNNELIAGEIGYIIGKKYTSLSGFSSKEKRFRNFGTAQMVLLAQYLQQNGFDFWNLGHPYMDYKLALGAKIYTRNDFLKRWYNVRN